MIKNHDTIKGGLCRAGYGCWSFIKPLNIIKTAFLVVVLHTPVTAQKAMPYNRMLDTGA